MGLLDKISGIFSQTQNISVEEVREMEEVFEERRENKLDKIDKRCREFRQRTINLMEDLEEDLGEVEGFEDYKDRAVIEDNIQNFVETRKRLIDDFSHPDDLEKLHNELGEFLKEFNEMSQKDEAVLEEASIDSEFSGSLKDLTELEKEMESFLQNEFRTRERYEALQKELSDLEETEEKIPEVKNELESLNIDKLQQELQGKEDEIGEIENSPLKDRYDKIKEELDEKDGELDSLYGEFSEAIGRTERGLKKLIYDGEIGKVSSEGSEILREIRDGEKQELMKRDPEKVEEAAEAATDAAEESELKEKTRKKLVKGLETLEDFRELRRDLKDGREEKKQLQEKLKNHQYMEKKNRLSKEKEKIERDLSKEENRLKELEEKKESLEEQEEELKREVIDIVESEFDSEVVIGGTEQEN